MALTLITGPTHEPVTLDELKQQTRIDYDTQDDLLIHYIRAAREWVEGQTGRAIMTQTWDYTIDGGWPYRNGYPIIMLPLNPVSSVTSITYIDGASPDPTLSASKYDVAARNYGSYIAPSYGASWPTPRNVVSAITIRFVAGNDNDVPYGLKQAILLVAAHMEANRGDGPNEVSDIPGLEGALSPWRSRGVT